MMMIREARKRKREPWSAKKYDGSESTRIVNLLGRSSTTDHYYYTDLYGGQLAGFAYA